MIVWLSLAHAQDYAFPTSIDDYSEYYPTAYRDNGGTTDWDCQSLTYTGHQGSDFGGGSFTGMDEGRDVTAAADGVVIATNDGELDRCTTGDCYGGGGFGNYVYLEHADGKVTIYGHLKQWSVLVSTGDAVTCGQKMGEMGSSGYSTGPHLHFQVDNSAGYSEDPFDGPCSAPPSYWIDQGLHGDLPGNDCGPPPTCTPKVSLGCGDSYVSSNDGPGSTSTTWQYGCSDFVYSGPELSFTFQTSTQTPVDLSLTGLSGDLDLYVLGSAECAGNDCISASTSPYEADEALNFVAEADTEYVIVVDGWEGAVSPFELQVACEIEPETTTDVTEGDPPEQTDPGQIDTATDGGEDLANDLTSSEPKVIPGSSGCGCDMRPSALQIWPILAVSALIVRRGVR